MRTLRPLLLPIAFAGCMLEIEGSGFEQEVPSTALAWSADCPGIAIKSHSASADDGHVAANVSDGSASTRWSCAGSCWIVLDFGSVRTISRADIAWYRGSERKAKFELEVSLDGVTWQTVVGP